jgi:arylsulfatase A-like enzyme
MTKISRRDFLKLGSIASAGAALSGALPVLSQTDQNKPNILVLVFDAMTARHVSVYGYERETTPNLAKLASRANVYHRNYSPANFTTPGTSSILTGLHPWTHRAINLHGLVSRSVVDQNIFHLLADYRRIGFTQNPLAELLLGQFAQDLDEHWLPSEFGLFHPTANQLGHFFSNDLDAVARAGQLLYSMGSNDLPPGSLIGGLIEWLGYNRGLADPANKKEYPLAGFPTILDSHFAFRMDDLFDGLSTQVKELASGVPFFMYAHLIAPHAPYLPRKVFNNLFKDDGVDPVVKPDHKLVDQRYPLKTLINQSRRYDQYIADLDDAFGKMIDAFESNRVLDNTYLFVISDHGELFERSEWGHRTALLYEPVITTPLIISVPGQDQRRDVFAPTSNLDLLPTWLSLAGKPIPAWSEGKILPGFANAQAESDRGIFAIEAKQNVAFAPLTKATIALIKNDKKLIKYLGYNGAYADAYEFYDLGSDRGEMNDRYADAQASPDVTKMKDEIMTALDEANKRSGNGF